MGNIYKGKVNCCSVQIRLVVVWLKLMYGFGYVCRSMAFWLFYLTILILQEQSTVHDQLSCKLLQQALVKRGKKLGAPAQAFAASTRTTEL